MKLNLKKIDLSKREDCRHPDIKTRTKYLVCYDGVWILGSFSRQWYGWSFDWFCSAMCGIQLDGLDSVFEITTKLKRK